MKPVAIRPFALNGYKEPATYVRAQLLWLLDYSRTYEVRFDACLKEARHRHNKEVAEDALTRPMPVK